jgi:trimeric autotransporter adhesin
VGITDIATVDSSGTIGRDTTVRPAIVSLQATQTSQGSALAALQAFNSTQGSRLSALENGQANLFNLVDLNRKEARRGIATVAAMAPAHFPSAPGKTSYSANTAVYRGEVAFSVSMAHRLNSDRPFALTAGVSHSGGKDTAARVGVAGEF